jgi:Asparagine synthase (glutamine-hydrolyzing)
MIVHQNGIIDGPHRYWELQFVPDRSISENEWAERLNDALQGAVDCHLVSDVPFGAFLSGGIDSSSIVAYMSRKLKTPVQTFTIGFDDVDYDERPYAAQAAEVLGAVHTEELVHADALGILPTLVRHYGEPFGDSSAVCTYYVARAGREHVKMVLSGDGGDETHGGYEYFAKMMLSYPEAQSMFERMRRIAGRTLCGMGLKQRMPLLAKVWYDRSPYFGEITRKHLWKPDFRKLMDHTREWNDSQFKPVEKYDILSQCQHVDINTYLVNDNLFKVDIAAMAKWT